LNERKIPHEFMRDDNESPCRISVFPNHYRPFFQFLKFKIIFCPQNINPIFHFVV